MNDFLDKWGEAAYTTAGFFWMALWAFILGYIISSCIQIFVTEEKMRKTMGKDNAKSVALGTFFGFISSSCSFAALATTKSLFKKGAGFVSSVAFLLASTNLVIELGFVIAIFLGWQFVAGEYAGGILLILFSWLLIRLIRPKKLISRARKNLKEEDKEEKAGKTSWKKKIRSAESWAKVSRQYAMEWKMVWKDVTLGFTVAGIVATFVPDAFFRMLFINSGTDSGYGFLTLLEHVMVGPLAAFLTFIGSMGNIPLAALLFGKGVSFAGVMAFIFSDLVVFPVLRINARYYGWKMSLFILFLLVSALVVTSLLLHYGFELSGLLPDSALATITETEHFKLNYTFFINIFFLLLSGGLLYYGLFRKKEVKYHKEMAPKSKYMERTLKVLAFICYGWLAGGVIVKLFM